MIENKPIVFVFPYRGVGGVSLLFLRLAEYIASNLNRQIFIVDYSDGYMAKHLICTSVQLIEYYDDRSVLLPENAVLIFQSMTPWSLFKSLEFDLTHKFLFWNCHPYNLVPAFPGLRVFLLSRPALLDVVNSTVLLAYKLKIKRFLNLLLEKKSIIFMDQANVLSTFTRLGVDVKSVAIDYLPIPVIDIASGVAKSRCVDKKLVRVTWVGRIADFKYTILCRAIERISAAQELLKINMLINIVGDGDYKDALVANTKHFTNLKFNFIDHIDSHELDEFLAANTDLLMAMGTSALEGAKLRIPTILLDFSYSSVSKNYHFKWLHNHSGFNLGAPIGKSQLFKNDQSMQQRIVELLETPLDIGNDAYDYVKSHHSLPVVAFNLLKYIEQSNCYYQDFIDRALLGRGFLYGLFSKLRRLVN